MRLAVQSDFPVSGQLAFFAGLHGALAAAHNRWEVFPTRFSWDQIGHQVRLIRELDAFAGTLIREPDRSERDGGNPFTARCDLGQFSQMHATPVIGLDYHETGIQGATALIDAGATALYVLVPPTQWRSRQLMAGVRVGTAGRDRDPERVLWGPRPDPALLGDWLDGLPDGAGILCHHDASARLVCEWAQRLDRPLGEALRVIGIGDDPENKLWVSSSLSSFALPYTGIGQAVAAWIQTLEGSNGPEAARSCLLPPEGLNRRASLQRSLDQDGLVDRVLTWMVQHLQESISITEVARIHGISRRTLELKFARSRQQSPQRAWNGLRLERSCLLLRQTDLRVAEIAERCGFQSQSRFTQFFTAHQQCTPRDFRTGFRPQ